MTFVAGILPGETSGVARVVEEAMEAFALIFEALVAEGVKEI